MTTLSIEELKKMADELGYKLVKKQQHCLNCYRASVDVRAEKYGLL